MNAGQLKVSASLSLESRGALALIRSLIIIELDNSIGELIGFQNKARKWKCSRSKVEKASVWDWGNYYSETFLEIEFPDSD